MMTLEMLEGTVRGNQTIPNGFLRVALGTAPRALEIAWNPLSAHCV